MKWVSGLRAGLVTTEEHGAHLQPRSAWDQLCALGQPSRAGPRSPGRVLFQCGQRWNDLSPGTPPGSLKRRLLRPPRATTTVNIIRTEPQVTGRLPSAADAQRVHQVRRCPRAPALLEGTFRCRSYITRHSLPSIAPCQVLQSTKITGRCKRKSSAWSHHETGVITEERLRTRELERTRSPAALRRGGGSAGDRATAENRRLQRTGVEGTEQQLPPPSPTKPLPHPPRDKPSAPAPAATSLCSQ